MADILLLRQYLETVYKKRGATDSIFLHGVHALKHQEETNNENYGMRKAGFCPECHQSLPKDVRWWDHGPSQR